MENVSDGIKVLCEDAEFGSFYENIRMLRDGAKNDDRTVIKCVFDIQSVIQKESALFFVAKNQCFEEILHIKRAQLIRGLILDLFHWSSIPSIKCSDVRQSCENDYNGVTDRLESFAAFIETVLLAINEIKAKRSGIKEFLKEILNPILTKLIIICAMNSKAFLWNNQKIVDRCSHILNLILSATGVKSLDNILINHENNTDFHNVATAVLDQLLPSLAKDNWKQNPASQHALRFCLNHIKFPALSDFLHQVFPPVLLFADDYDPEHKVIGLKCINHIIENCSKEELRWYGRADVLYDCLHHELFSKDLAVVEALHPCLLGILRIVEQNPKKEDSEKGWNKYDDVMVQILSDVEIETHLTVRREIVRHLPLYISAMGITAIRHSKRFLRVTQAFLEQYDGPSEEARIFMLLALKVYIRETWPRIDFHYQNVLKMLMKLLYDMSVDETLIAEEVKDEVMNSAVDCVLVLHNATNQNGSDLKEMSKKDFNPAFNLYLKKMCDGLD